eukprot:3429149-Pyramimonas_sp.AAC.1
MDGRCARTRSREMKTRKCFCICRERLYWTSRRRGGTCPVGGQGCIRSSHRKGGNGLECEARPIYVNPGFG